MTKLIAKNIFVALDLLKKKKKPFLLFLTEKRQKLEIYGYPELYDKKCNNYSKKINNSFFNQNTLRIVNTR